MINANEQRIIDVAGGAFEYKGELYTVRSNYMKALQKKLDQDNCELTAEQSDQVILQIFGNIERGVKERILKKISEEESKKVRKEGKVHSLQEIGLTGEGVSSSKAKTGQNTTEKGGDQTGQTSETQTVMGKDGQSYPVQQTPIQTEKLDQIRLNQVESVQVYTADDQIASQLNTNKGQILTTMLISWAVCIAALTVYLKVFKHRRKAFKIMTGAGLASLALFVMGTVFVYNTRTYSTDAWHTIALESGYFKECSKNAHTEMQKVLSDVGVEAEAEFLGLDENTVYRDAKSIFASRLAGKGLPKLEKRKKQMQEALWSVLPKEPTENVEKLTNVLLEHYRKELDAPYASYLHEQKQKEYTRNVFIILGGVIVLLISFIFIWKGSTLIHRRFRGLSYGIGVGGIGFIVASVADKILKKSLQIEPKVYQILFEQHLRWVNENILYLGILLFCVAIFTWCAAYVTKKNRMNKRR